MTEDQAEIIFHQLKRRTFFTPQGDIQELPFDQVDRNCYVRAHHMAVELIAAGIPCKKIWVAHHPINDENKLWVESETSENPYGPAGRPGAPARINWIFHVAPVVTVLDGWGAVKEMVFDPSVSYDRPLTTNEWLHMMHVNPAEIVPIGETSDEVMGNLHQAASNPEFLTNDLGLPLGMTTGYKTEPEAFYRPVIGGPRTSTMDDAHSAARAQYGDLEAQANYSHYIQEERQREAEAARMMLSSPVPYQVGPSGTVSRDR